MNLKCRTGANKNIKDKPKVYFTCHPDDFQFCFFKICDDLLKVRDCAIYYTEDMSSEIPDEDKKLDIASNNLFVIAVTRKLLTTPNRAMDSDYPYASQDGMRILPIMMESGLDEIYSQKDKFGERQYLKAHNYDSSEISYADKLKKYLESVFLGEELTNRIRAEFDAYVFLSYRKKDRHYANQLMRLIHSNPECRDVAIWYDEFLTPGESFNDSIKNILESCQLFTLLVTPQLLEKVINSDGEYVDNYVISTELPLARKNKSEKGIEIFAVEMETTDSAALAALDVVDYVNSKDQNFRIRLLEIISRIANSANNTPLHNYLIGLAYLEGVDVEVDRRRGVDMILGAADAGCREALCKIADMSEDKDVKVAQLTKAVLVAEKEIKEEYSYKLLDEMLELVTKLFDIQMHYKVWEAKELFIRMVDFDAYLRGKGLYQQPDDIKRLCGACANLFRHRAKKMNIFYSNDEENNDFEEWLVAFESLSSKEDLVNDQLAMAYQNYIECLEEKNVNEGCLTLANKLVCMSIKEAEKHKVELKDDYSEKFYFDVPNEVRTYTFWLEMTFVGYLHMFKACENNRRNQLLCLRKLLELKEYLRGHAVTYSFCSDVAFCYKILGRVLESEGKMELSRKAYEYASIIEDGMPKRKKIIPEYNEELYATVNQLIESCS